MNSSGVDDRSRRRIFIAHATEDAHAAEEIAKSLTDAGIGVWLDKWEMVPGESLTQHIEQSISANDVILALISHASAGSNWMQAELASRLQTLNDRAITVLPVVIEDCEVPPALSDRVYLDLRDSGSAASQRIVAQLAAVPDISFSKLSPRSFERLAEELLTDIGFDVTRYGIAADGGFDFRASYVSRDAFGAERAETWVVQAKLYREERISVSLLQRILTSLTSIRATKALIITSGRMTSVAREFLAEMEHHLGYELRVIDGPELVGLLVQHPSVAQRYFGASR